MTLATKFKRDHLSQVHLPSRHILSLGKCCAGRMEMIYVSLSEPIHGSDETECLEEEVRSVWGDIEDVAGNRGDVSEPPLTPT